ncbi:alanine racemase [Curtobacterium flaccumfaciens]|nr:alanine racemase [Curtobacterium flaccumfaciens]
MTTTPGTVTTKGAPDPAAPPTRHVLDHAYLPVMTLRESALANNAAVMQAYVERHRMLFAPHMKTHMAPALAGRQIDAGAWGVTVASVQQAMVAWEHGIHRILVANEVLDPAGLAWLASRRAADPAADVLCYVDSPAGIEAGRAAQATVDGDLHVVVEVGFPGGRTGVRSGAAARDLAQLRPRPRPHTPRGVRVRGRTARRRRRTRLRRGRARGRCGRPAAGRCAARAAQHGRERVVRRGGRRGRRTPDDLDVLLRSGAYLTHDDGFYADRTPFGRHPEEGALVPAIEVWGRVTSCPEPGLALVAVGKRDISFDEGLPVVRTIRRGGAADVVPVAPAPGAVTVTRLDDQHCYLALADGAPGLTPGDVVVFGISHPCTVFDKWRQVLVIDDDETVLESIATWF